MKTIFDNPWLRSLAITCLMFSLVMTTGCNGCRNDAEDDIADKKEDGKKKKRKDDFETNTPVLLPGFYPKTIEERKRDESQEDEDPLAKVMRENRAGTMANRVKPGHWYTASVQAVANNFNADGELTAYAVDGSGRPVRVPSTKYFLKTTRPVSLPKGEWKNFETSVFIPTRESRVSSATVNFSINRTTSGLPMRTVTQPTAALRPHQSHIVLMSNRPDIYKFLNLADAIRLRGTMVNAENIPPFHYIVPTEAEKPLPLPQHALNWTTISHMIWDNYDPSLLGAEHQQALIDWIHFGGQLIVSGPDCLDKLQTSFLADYLPAHFDGSRNLVNADMDELNKNWTVEATRNKSIKRIFQISDKVPLLGVTFKPHDDAEFIKGTGEIAIERQIGRGRIAITAFSLSAPAVRKWPSFKSFLNGALLRKPARKFGKSEGDEIVFEWANDKASVFDPMLHSSLRFIARDLSFAGTEESYTYSGRPGAEGSNVIGASDNEISLARADAEKVRNRNDAWRYGGYQDAKYSGVGGWNDNSGIGIAARETLREAAGITPPSSDFVLKMLAGYLFVLVPLNWFVFRMIGKVELAWLAAPFIAIIGALLVVKLAALDIGFVRSNTQIGVLEIHADYPRGHLAEYSALYTSLSTRYNAELDNISAQSLPFATDRDVLNESTSEVRLRRTVSSSLEGFQIQSNTTGLLHTEYILDLMGVVSFFETPSEGKPFVLNSTNIDLTEAGVITRVDKDTYKFAWIGDLPSKADADLDFETRDSVNLTDNWISSPVFQNTNRTSSEIWKKNMGDAEKANLGEMSKFPEVAARWEKIKTILLLSQQDGDSGRYSKQAFDNAYGLANSESSVTLGRMFDAVINNLTLSPGEFRLIAATKQRLGGTKFDPESTQIDQQTLVVIHLQQPSLPLAQKDVNGYEDFASARSNLDWEREDEEYKQMMKELEQ